MLLLGDQASLGQQLASLTNEQLVELVEGVVEKYPEMHKVSSVELELMNAKETHTDPCTLIDRICVTGHPLFSHIYCEALQSPI